MTAPDTSEKIEIGIADKLHILQHSLGVDQYGEGRHSRNIFVTGPDGSDFITCTELVKAGLMINRGSSALSGGGDCFVVTPKGVDFVALNSPAKPKLTRSQKNYRNFLDADCGFSFGEWMRFSRDRS